MEGGIQVDIQARSHVGERGEAIERRERIVDADPRLPPTWVSAPSPARLRRPGLESTIRSPPMRTIAAQAAEVDDPRARDPQVALELGARTVALLESIDLELGRDREVRQKAVSRGRRASDDEHGERRHAGDDAEPSHFRSSPLTNRESRPAARTHSPSEPADPAESIHTSEHRFGRGAALRLASPLGPEKQTDRSIFGPPPCVILLRGTAPAA